MLAFWKVCSCSFLVGAPFALITSSIRRGMEVISLWHCWCGMEAQVSLTVAFNSSVIFGLLFLIFLLTIPHRFSTGFRSGEFAGQSSTPTHGHLTNFWCFWQCTSVCVQWIYLIHEFHNLSWITEINELFHNIIIYWDAPVLLMTK